MQLYWVDVMRLDGCVERHVGITSTETSGNSGVDLREVKGLLYLLTHLSPWMCLNLGKFELGVVWVHLSDLLTGRGAENLDRTERKNRTQHVFTMNSYLFVEEKQIPWY